MNWLQGWSADPAVILTAAVAGLLYLRGRAVLRDLGPTRPDWREEWWQWPSFCGALAALLLASCSPIDAYSATLFWVHMIQHLLLFMFVAPLIVAVGPWLPLWYGLPAEFREALGRAARRAAQIRSLGHVFVTPVGALGVFVAGTWLWHVPVLYNLALSNDVIHDYGEHNTFLAIGILFWLQIIPSPPFQRTLGSLGSALYLGAAIVQNVALSVILAFWPVPLYAYANLASRPGNISAHTDQQIGASIMWAVGDLPFVIAFASLIMVWLGRQFAHPDEETPSEALTAGGPA